VIDEQHKTHLQPISIGRDYGTSLEVLQGLSATDWIVLNPPDSLEENVTVNVKQPPPPSGANGSPSTSGAAQQNSTGDKK
jgi:hypothetical protein